MSTILPKVNFNNFTGAAFQKIKDELSGAFPVRVINVKDTVASDGGIVFHKPADWNFHTISHRWTPIIEDLSNEVGRRVKANAKGGPNEANHYSTAYDLLFKREKFKGREGYERLIDFLRILEEDGVRLAWFDTLCINQSDDMEKGREIKHMGEFYSLSLGCYVAMHGFGHGFAALGERGHVPSWFSRAWTLQEFLLPKKLTFVVELKIAQFNSVVKFVRTTHLDAKCACGGKVGSSEWPWGKGHALETANDNREFWRVLKCSEYKCTRGRFERAGGESPGSSHMYFVDRNAYIPVVNIIYDKVQEVWDLGVRLGLVCQGETIGLVKEISDRDCTIEEDRALCMLALLGATGEGGVEQVRVGQGLERQLVELGKAVAKCNVEDLIKLCAVEAMPSPMMGMSWFPRLTKRTDKSNSYNEVETYMASIDRDCVANMKEFRSKVDRVIVSDAGRLSLTCPIMRARLVPLNQHVQNCKHVTNKVNGKGCVSCCRINDKHENCFLPSLHQEWILDMHQGHALPFHSSPLANTETSSSCHGLLHKHVSSCHAFWPHLLGIGQNNYVESNYYFRGGLLLDEKILDIANILLLLLGTSIENRPYWSPQTVLMFMVCSGDSTHMLHKIGHIRVLPTYDKMKASSKIDYDHLQKADCTVR